MEGGLLHTKLWKVLKKEVGKQRKTLEKRGTSKPTRPTERETADNYKWSWFHSLPM